MLALVFLTDWYKELHESIYEYDETKEEYRDFMHNLTDRMEAVQRKRHAQSEG